MGPTLQMDAVGNEVLLAYRSLVAAESRLGETLARRGQRIGASVADQWPLLHDFLHLYGKSLAPAGIVVLGGAPDAGSRHTGIPFTGPREAREILGLRAEGKGESPSALPFWRAVEDARLARNDAPLESLFATTHLAHAIPYDAPFSPDVEAASVAHVLGLLERARPQAIVPVGREAVFVLARALESDALEELAESPEEVWAEHWSHARLSACPWADVPARRPFRARILPLPSLTGGHALTAQAALERLFAYALA